MLKTATFLAAASTALLLSGGALADVIYDNGGPNFQNGNEATFWIQAEDFTLPTDTTLTGAGVYIADISGGDAFDGSLEYWIFGDNDGSPGGSLANGLASVTRTDLHTPPACCANGTSWLYAFDFNSPFNALGGVTYWLGIHLDDGYDTRRELYWIDTTPAGGGDGGCDGECPAAGIFNGHESLGGTQDNWVSNGAEHAFFLTGAGGVPEPETWALMILGFGAAGATLRVRRKLAA